VFAAGHAWADPLSIPYYYYYHYYCYYYCYYYYYDDYYYYYYYFAQIPDLGLGQPDLGLKPILNLGLG